MEINKTHGEIGKRESMGKYNEKRELVGTRHHEILIAPSDLLLEDSSQN